MVTDSGPVFVNAKYLPSSWKLVRLADVAKTSSGGTPSRGRADFYGGSIPWVKSGELRDRIIYKTEESISEEGLAASSAKLFPRGTVCIALYGATVGRLGVLGTDAATNQAVCGIFPGPAVEPRYLYRFLESRRQDLIEQGKGGAQSNISQAIVREISIPLPPITEQQRIVAEIEKQFTRLDAAVAALKRAHMNLGRYRSSILKAACEGRLVPTEADFSKASGSPYETATALLDRILSERQAMWRGRGTYRQPLVVPNTDDLPRLPGGWLWCSSDALFCFVTSGSRGWARYYSNVGAIFLRIGNLNHESIRLDLREVQHVNPPINGEGVRTIVRPNDILLSITADVGMVGLVPDGLGEAYINQHVALARPLPSISAAYLAYFLCASDGGWGYLKKLQRGATKAGLGLDDIRAVPVPLPPLAEQMRIVAELRRRLSGIEELGTAIAANLQRAINLRQSILHRAFSGTL